MGKPRWTTERLRGDLDLLGSRGLSTQDYFAELSPRLRRVVDNDASCWHTMDPHALLLTSDAPTELVGNGIFTEENVNAAGELMIRSEYLIEDSNTFAALATGPRQVATLDTATGGNPESSARYRDLTVPAGIPHELRAAFLIRGRAWGAVHIARREESGAFEAKDEAALAAVAGTIARGIRSSLRFEAARRATGPESPGLVMLGPDNEVEFISAPARGLLADLRGNQPGRGNDLPMPIYSLANFIRVADPREAIPQSSVTVPGTSGWFVLHASREDEDRTVTVVIEPASGPRSATLRLETHGVTPREREIATLIARGYGNNEIAEELVLSPHTVQDYVKNIFEKLGVNSRRELVASVFMDEYLPEVMVKTPLTTHGRFDVEAGK
ncbi:MAG: helix-turn-helix transcriptional regulator [Solirubrobacterales bacterium]